jgi:hypothetical protein
MARGALGGPAVAAAGGAGRAADVLTMFRSLAIRHALPAGTRCQGTLADGTRCPRLHGERRPNGRLVDFWTAGGAGRCSPCFRRLLKGSGRPGEQRSDATMTPTTAEAPRNGTPRPTPDDGTAEGIPPLYLTLRIRTDLLALLREAEQAAAAMTERISGLPVQFRDGNAMRALGACGRLRVAIDRILDLVEVDTAPVDPEERLR